MALGALLIKPAYKALSDEGIAKEIVMNPYLQYFLGLHEYRYECPFDPSMMTRFRQRITPEIAFQDILSITAANARIFALFPDD